MMRYILFFTIFLFLMGCSSTTETKEKEKKENIEEVNLYRTLTSMNVKFIDNPDYFLYIIPKSNILTNNYDITARGKKIINTIFKLHDNLSRENTSIIGHSSTIHPNPYDDSIKIVEGSRDYIEEKFKIENIIAFSKGGESPVFQKKSYNHFKQNERLEIIIIKNKGY